MKRHIYIHMMKKIFWMWLILILAVQKPILYKFENVTDLAFSVFSCHFTYQSQKYEFALNDQYMHSWFYDYSPFKVTNVSDGDIEFIEEYTADDF